MFPVSFDAPLYPSASVTMKACDAPTSKTKKFNFHSGRYYIGWEFAGILTKVNPMAKITVNSGLVEYICPMVDISAAVEALGFSPRCSFINGLKV